MEDPQLPSTQEQDFHLENSVQTEQPSSLNLPGSTENTNEEYSEYRAHSHRSIWYPARRRR